MGNTPGVILAAILLTVLPEMLRPVARVPDGALLASPDRPHARPARRASSTSTSPPSRRGCGGATWPARRCPGRRPMPHPPPARQGDHPLRGAHGRERARPGGQRGRPGRPDRPERRGQDDRLQPGHRRVPADERDGVAPTARAWRACGRTRSSSAGIARTFQNIRLFRSLSVFDNVRVACNLHRTSGARPGAPADGGVPRTTRPRSRGASEELLELFHLRRYRDAPATSLPYGSSAAWRSCARLATQPGSSSSTSPRRA